MFVAVWPPLRVATTPRCKKVAQLEMQGLPLADSPPHERTKRFSLSSAFDLSCDVDAAALRTWLGIAASITPPILSQTEAMLLLAENAFERGRYPDTERHLVVCHVHAVQPGGECV